MVEVPHTHTQFQCRKVVKVRTISIYLTINTVRAGWVSSYLIGWVVLQSAGDGTSRLTAWLVIYLCPLVCCSSPIVTPHHQRTYKSSNLRGSLGRKHHLKGLMMVLERVRWDLLHIGYYDDDCSLAPLEGCGAGSHQWILWTAPWRIHQRTRHMRHILELVRFSCKTARLSKGSVAGTVDHKDPFRTALWQAAYDLFDPSKIRFFCSPGAGNRFLCRPIQAPWWVSWAEISGRFGLGPRGRLSSCDFPSGSRIPAGSQKDPGGFEGSRFLIPHFIGLPSILLCFLECGYRRVSLLCFDARKPVKPNSPTYKEGLTGLTTSLLPTQCVQWQRIYRIYGHGWHGSMQHLGATSFKRLG